MDARLVQIKLDLRLNKLASEDYDNIECWQKREAVNKARLEWPRRQLHGVNMLKEGDEESVRRVDDLEFLLTEKKLFTFDKGIYHESESLPSNYGWFKTLRVYASSKEGCSGILISDLHHIEEANVNSWLNDWAKEPSFEYRQAFYTLANNKIRVYTNKNFDIDNISLIYYRKPKEFDIEGCTWYDGRLGINSDLEFKDDVAELIIDEAVSILAGDIESSEAYQISSKRKEENN